jgi:hypothetical protein
MPEYPRLDRRRGSSFFDRNGPEDWYGKALLILITFISIAALLILSGHLIYLVIQDIKIAEKNMGNHSERVYTGRI